jgi:hypothetical protein
VEAACLRVVGEWADRRVEVECLPEVGEWADHQAVAALEWDLSEENRPSL